MRDWAVVPDGQGGLTVVRGATWSGMAGEVDCCGEGDELADIRRQLAAALQAGEGSRAGPVGEDGVETRIVPGAEFRLVERPDLDGKFAIEGYAAVFNQLSVDLGGFVEKIEPGAFTRSLKRDVWALFNHNPDMVLGRTRAKTLELEEDEHGLRMTILPPDTQWANDLLTLIRRGDVTQSSFAFRVIKDKWERDSDDKKPSIRTLIQLELRDVSPCIYPAYPQTKVQARTAFFEAAGVDLTMLQRALVRAQHGIGLGQEDEETIRAAIEALLAVVPDVMFSSIRRVGDEDGKPPEPRLGEGGDGGEPKLPPETSRETLRREEDLRAAELMTAARRS